MRAKHARNTKAEFCDQVALVELIHSSEAVMSAETKPKPKNNNRNPSNSRVGEEWEPILLEERMKQDLGAWLTALRADCLSGELWSFPIPIRQNSEGPCDLRNPRGQPHHVGEFKNMSCFYFCLEADRIRLGRHTKYVTISMCSRKKIKYHFLEIYIILDKRGHLFKSNGKINTLCH